MNAMKHPILNQYHLTTRDIKFIIIELDDNEFDISGGEMVLIEDGVFHRVHNTGEIDLYMVCVFDGDRNH